MIVVAVSSPVLVHDVFPNLVLSALVKNLWLVHSDISSASHVASSNLPLVAITDKSQGCTAVAHALAQLLIVDKSDIAFCLLFQVVFSVGVTWIFLFEVWALNSELVKKLLSLSP